MACCAPWLLTATCWTPADRVSIRLVLAISGDREQWREQPGQTGQDWRSGETSPPLAMTSVALGDVRQPFALDLVLQIGEPLRGDPGQQHRIPIDDHHSLPFSFGAGFEPRVSLLSRRWGPWRRCGRSGQITRTYTGKVTMLLPLPTPGLEPSVMTLLPLPIPGFAPSLLWPFMSLTRPIALAVSRSTPAIRPTSPRLVIEISFVWRSFVPTVSTRPILRRG